MSSFVENYVLGKLAEIAAALDDLDTEDDRPEVREARQRLLELQAQLIGLVATFGEPEAPVLN